MRNKLSFMVQVLTLAEVALGDEPVLCSGIYRGDLSCEKEHKHLLKFPTLRTLLTGQDIRT